jgi:AraC family transcriptional regulator
MEMMQSFNKTIRYIESALDTDIDERKIAHLSTYSYAMFSRLFSILTNMTLSEYIRLRRLSKAAVEIRESSTRVIDIAMKYGYESSDSFTNAFKNFHEVTPSEVRHGKAYKVVSPIHLAISVSGGKHMEVKIQKRDCINLAGVKLENIDSMLCADAWESFILCMTMKNCVFR